jgi:hypothetical protein
MDIVERISARMAEFTQNRLENRQVPVLGNPNVNFFRRSQGSGKLQRVGSREFWGIPYYVSTREETHIGSAK